jgi:hypothetical protein
MRNRAYELAARVQQIHAAPIGDARNHGLAIASSVSFGSSERAKTSPAMASNASRSSRESARKFIKSRRMPSSDGAACKCNVRRRRSGKLEEPWSSGNDDAGG